ncbi:MAG: hypothetical protein WB987_01800 [Candidatus Acidiferrales bacterium]
MNWLRIATFTQLLLTAYWLLIVCVPLGAWNRQPGHQAVLESFWKGELDSGGIILTFAFALPGLLFSFGWREKIRLLMWFALIFDGVWFGLQVWSWWVPYIFGASAQWQRTYERTFSRTLNFLPTFGKHLAPDAMHTFLQIFLLLAIVTALRGLVPTLREVNPEAGEKRADSGY